VLLHVVLVLQAALQKYEGSQAVRDLETKLYKRLVTCSDTQTAWESA
jgi:hypothetical protein